MCVSWQRRPHSTFALFFGLIYLYFESVILNAVLEIYVPIKFVYLVTPVVFK